MKMIFRMKRKIINIPIFDKTIEVIWNKDLSKIQQYLLDTFSEETFPTLHPLSAGATWMLSTGYIIIGLTSNDSTLIHELGHCVWRIVQLCGIEDEETFCYLLEYIYKEITND